MMYSMVFSDSALKQFEKLERSVQLRISAALERIRVRPQAFLRRLVGKETYRLRVGDYRVIADLEHQRLLILVIEVGHRKNIYD
ncbi:type II toxin-antitoxin system RelE/ParE family toxin [Candidatus Woesearchaeota archaeon]|nr:type II toxin-antitoxin system RelE/ParE family toxin [Candidatus Woesearchaeota archaeon]